MMRAPNGFPPVRFGRTAAVWFLLLSACAALLLPRSGRAQVPFRSTAALGVGGGGPAYVQEMDAMFLNPANIALSRHEGRRAMSVLQIGDQFGGSLLQTNFYEDYLAAGRTLSDADVEALLDGWFGADLRAVRNRADVLLAGFVLRGERMSYGGGVRFRSYVEGRFNRGWADLVLRGMEDDRTVPVDGEIRSFSSFDLSVTLARQQTERLRVGITPKLVLGVDYSKGELDSEIQIGESELRHRFDYTLTAAGLAGNARDQIRPFADDRGDVSVSGGVAGFGLGVDVGATYRYSDRLRLAASLRDLGAVNWSSDAYTITPAGEEFRFEGFEYDSERIDREFDGDFGDYAEHVLDSLAEASYRDTEKEEGAFIASLPTSFSAGANYELGPKATVAGGIGLALARTGGLVRTPTGYVGGEYRLGSARYHVPLRVGVRAGGIRALAIGFGTGFSGPGYDLSVSAMTTPSSEMLGSGGRFAVSAALLTFRW